MSTTRTHPADEATEDEPDAPSPMRTWLLVGGVLALLLVGGAAAAWAAWVNPQSMLPTPTPHQLPGAEDVRPMPGD